MKLAICYQTIVPLCTPPRCWRAAFVTTWKGLERLVPYGIRVLRVRSVEQREDLRMIMTGYFFCAKYRGVLKWGYPQIIHLNGIFLYQPSSYWVPPFSGNPHIVHAMYIYIYTYFFACTTYAYVYIHIYIHLLHILISYISQWYPDEIRWSPQLLTMIPSFGSRLSETPGLAETLRRRTAQDLQL